MSSLVSVRAIMCGNVSDGHAYRRTLLRNRSRTRRQPHLGSSLSACLLDCEIFNISIHLFYFSVISIIFFFLIIKNSTLDVGKYIKDMFDVHFNSHKNLQEF